MRPMRLRAINFATHQDTEIRLKNVDAAVILGMNGSGKSSMMIDCLLVSVFGKGRTGDLDNYIKIGTTMMTAEADVRVNGRYYRTIRKRSKKTSRGETLLEFYEIDDLGNELINLTQGTIGDTQSLILRTYGTDFDTVCRTNILEQGEADYFCKATPAERMALFSQVWDLEKYDEMAQIEKEEVGVIKEKIRTLDEAREACITKLDAVGKDKEELEVLKRTNAELSRTVDALERKKEKAGKVLAKYESLVEQEKKLDEGIRKINVDLEKAGEQHQSLLTRISRYEKIVKNKQVVLDHVELEKTKTAAMADLQEKRRLTLKLIEEVRAQIRAIEENTRKETDDMERRRAGYQKAVDEVNQTISKEKQRLVALGKSEEQLSFLQRDASKLEGVKCHPDADPEYVNEQCRFIKDAVVSKGKIPSLKDQIAKEKAAIDEAIKQYEEKLGGLRKGMEVCEEQIKAERAKAKSGTDAIDQKARKLTEEVNEYDYSIQGIETALVQVRKFTVLLGEVDLAEKEVPGLREESKKLEQQSSNWSTERERMRAERSKVTAQLEGRVALTEELQAVSGELSIVRGRRDESIKKQGGIEAQIAKADELKAQVKKIEEESSDLLTEKAIKGMAEDALRAIPFIMVARGIGVVESIANGMLSEISTRGLRVHIETEKMTKTTKKVKDEVHLVFQDQDGEKPYKMLSGGEQLRAAFSLRLALSEALAHRRGVRIDCLMADEPFGPLDNEGVDDMKLALREMRKRFGFMGVITHIEKAQDIFPVRFEFKYNQGVSEVSVVDDFQ